MVVFNASFVAAGLGRYAQAVAIASRSLHEFEEHGQVLDALDRRLLDRLECDARAVLGDDGYERMVRAGEAMTADRTVELVLNLMSRQPPIAAGDGTARVS